MKNDKNIVHLKEGDSTTIVIEVDKIFKRKLSQYKEFKIPKRSYHKKMPLLYLTIKEYIENNECLDYAYNILYFKYLVQTDETGEILKIENILSYVNQKIFNDEKLLLHINKEVEESYTLSLDSSINPKNENLQITDELNKTYLKSAIMMRLLLPIISAITDKITDNKEIDSIIYELFTEAMVFMNGGDHSILEKLFNIVSSRITQTRYSDKDAWDLLSKLNTDIIITRRDFNRYIAINNFIKIINNKSMISYIDVILKNKIDHLFTVKHKYAHKPLDYHNSSNNNSSDNELSEIDKLESNLVRKDSGIAFINKMSIIYEINKIYEKYNIDEQYIEEFKENVSINKFTISFLSIYYKNKIEELIHEDQYIYPLLYDLFHTLINKKFVLLPMLLISQESSHKNNNRRLIKEKLSDSIKYSLVLERYKDVANLVSKDSNFISEILTQIKQRKFIIREDEGEVELDLELDILKEEFLDFIFIES